MQHPGRAASSRGPAAASLRTSATTRSPATTWWSRPGPSAGRRTCPAFAARARPVDPAAALQRVPPTRPARARPRAGRRRLALRLRHRLRGRGDQPDDPVRPRLRADPVPPGHAPGCSCIFPVIVFVWRHVAHPAHARSAARRWTEIRLHGGPMLRVKRDDLAARGVERLHGPRGRRSATAGPLLDDGTVVDVDQRGLVHRLPAGRSTGSSCRSSARTAGREEYRGVVDAGARAVLLRAVVPVRVQLDGLPGRRPGRGVRRPPDRRTRVPSRGDGSARLPERPYARYSEG